MTITEPSVIASGRYSVNETSKILGIDRKTLYRHTIEGNIRCGFRRSNGRRFYTGSEIQRYWKAQY